MNENVTEKLLIHEQCNKIVTELIKIRTNAGFTQQFIADWLGVSRKKINEFENGKFDFDLMVKYANNLSIELNIIYTIH